MSWSRKLNPLTYQKFIFLDYTFNTNKKSYQKAPKHYFSAQFHDVARTWCANATCSIIKPTAYLRYDFVRLFKVTENWNYTYQKGRSNKERQSDWITLSYLSKIYYRIFDSATNEVVGQQNLLIDLSWLTALRLAPELFLMRCYKFFNPLPGSNCCFFTRFFLTHDYANICWMWMAILCAFCNRITHPIHETLIVAVNSFVYLYDIKESKVQQSFRTDNDTFVDRKMIDVVAAYLRPLNNNS